MSVRGDFGPAPTGINIEDDRAGQVYGGIIGPLILAALAIILRFVARTRKGNTLMTDDYLIVISWLLETGNAIPSILSVRQGCGKHLWFVRASEVEEILKILYSCIYLSVAAITVTRISILMFYRRTFGTTKAWYFCMAVTVPYWLASVISAITMCHPIRSFWNIFTKSSAKDHCWDTDQFFLATGIANLVIDLCILIYPLPMIWKLRLSASKKARTSCIILLGLFVCVAAAIRIVKVEDLNKSEDFTYNLAPVLIWSCVEPYIGIVCACLPTYTSLLRSLKQNRDDRSPLKQSHCPQIDMSFGSEKAKWERVSDEFDDLEIDDCLDMGDEIRDPFVVDEEKNMHKW